MTQLSAALAGQPLLIVLALLLTALLIVVMGAVTWNFDLRRGRLPLATRWDDLDQRVQTLAGEHTRKQAEFDELKRQIAERDHIGAELAVLQKMRDELKLELSGLDEGRQQIEEVKRKAAEAASEYAEISGKLQDARLALADAEERIARAAAVQDEIERLQTQLEDLQEARAPLENQLTELRVERARLLTARSEAEELAAKKTGLQQQLEQLQRNKDLAEVAAVDGERRRAEISEQLDRLRPEVAEAQARLVAERSEAGELAANKAAARQEIERLKKELEWLDGQVANRRSTGHGPVRVTEDEALGDLGKSPFCLSSQPGLDRAPELEADAVEDVCIRLKKLGLRYDRRIVRAFHTALKVNETAQLTVLAGVSGTGKSLLPRRYAEAMGIAFLQIAVEPRWDSPQDLLGFYNYVEQRYRATELARALVQMDRFNTSGLAKEPLRDRMLLVLLDEMNLARVEYYFSEFLSRLEVRPPCAEAEDEGKRRDSAMPIDIRGREQGSVYLFPSHNVLFAGTMNDDESTQSLSDKVLDRGNVMQFAAPQTFSGGITLAPPPPGIGYWRFSEWRSWVKPRGSLPDSDRRKTEDVVHTLRNIMERFGRPFGHRLNDAILTYVANYPRVPADLVNEPLADQIEFRILPKLRGVSISETRGEFEDLEKLIRDDLRDEAFAQRLAALRERQEGGTGQFNWRGLDRA